MTIAEQLTQTMEPLLDAVYAAGKAAGGGTSGTTDDISAYATQLKELFYKATFPEGYELVLNVPNAGESLNSMFRLATGLKKLTFNVPTNIAYKAGYFAYSTFDTASLEEIIFPENIRFSEFNYFARYCNTLRVIKGPIDTSAVTDYSNCFLRCNALQEVRFVPNSINVGISFANCENLSDASIASIINGLSLEASGQTLTVHPTVAAKIVETDVTDRGWILAC